MRVEHEPSTADDVASYILRQKYARERQEEWWREQVVATVTKADRDTLLSLADVLGLADRPPASWQSKREREIESLRRSIEADERDLAIMKHKLERLT